MIRVSVPDRLPPVAALAAIALAGVLLTLSAAGWFETRGMFRDLALVIAGLGIGLGFLALAMIRQRRTLAALEAERRQRDTAEAAAAAARAGGDTLRRQVQSLTEFMDAMPIGFFSVDQDGRFRFANALLAGWMGAAARDLETRGHHLHEVLVDPPRDGAPFDLFDGGGAEQQGEVTMIGLHGQRFQVSVTQSVVFGPEGAGAETRTLVRDRTPERAWQEALRLSEQRFQRFFEDAPIGIALVDAAGLLVECNPAFAALAERPIEGLSGLPVADLVRREQRAEVQARLKEALRDGRLAAPLDVRLAGRREMIAQLYVRRLGGAGREKPAMILHFIDATQQKNLEVQFIQSQKMQAVGQLAGGVAHDFNNLLTAMIGFCDLLLLRHKPGDQSFADIMQIKQNANRAANLVRQLLAFSRQQTLQPRVLDVAEVLDELANLLRRLIGEDIDLRILHGRDLGLVRVDQGQLEQAIINLAVNARDAMPRGGHLTVVTGNLSALEPLIRGHEAIPAGEYVLIEVIDSGVGIPEENLQRIFEPFFSTKEVGSGTGLGLSTVYGIVRQTGGFVFAESTPGEGAKFSVLLPRHFGPAVPDAAAPEQRDRSNADLTGSESVLLVEDEDAVRVFSARALRNKGYQVLEAKSGDAALEYFRKKDARIDLLITDVVMPQMDGVELYRHVRAERADMKVIFISGYAEDRFREQIGNDLHVHYLPKPFSLKQLAAKVKDVLQGDN